MVNKLEITEKSKIKNNYIKSQTNPKYKNFKK